MKLKHSTSRVLRVPLNANGKDFCIGDVHGAFSLVVDGLKAVGFDHRKDRLFSAGDLIDRGTESGRVLKFLSYPGLGGVVLGNHEANLLEIYADGEPDPEILKVYSRLFHMKWWLETTPEDRVAILAKLATLPVVIEVETARGTVGIVHGSVPVGMHWSKFLELVEAGDPEVLTVALESRDRIQSANKSGVPGVGRLIVGHTVQETGPQRLGNVFAIDTGAIFHQQYARSQNGLTIANLTFTTGMLVPHLRNDHPAAPGLFVLDNDTGADETPTPFGSYCS